MKIGDYGCIGSGGTYPRRLLKLEKAGHAVIAPTTDEKASRTMENGDSGRNFSNKNELQLGRTCSKTARGTPELKCWPES
jgi:hypothetical protein